jgi:hypothetical protein
VQKSYSQLHKRKKKQKADTITGISRQNSFHKSIRNEYKGDKTFKIKALQYGIFLYLAPKLKISKVAINAVVVKKKVITLML